MRAKLKHRGPDDCGLFVQHPLVLGSTRLAIIDQSSAAAQPMVLHDGDYVIVFNGEIYNYIELRQELSREGVQFITNSDTEVLLRLYMARGLRCLEHLRGMFAFAIWDRHKRWLFLARDRVGEKPLVYFNSDNSFIFASEIRAILTAPEIPRTFDPLAIHYGLHFVCPPAPFSAFKHIRKLGPSEYMLVSTNHFTIEKYWFPRFRPGHMFQHPKEAADALTHCLDKTVKIMCRSDVPIGATLSGGLDSSAVAVSMKDNIENFKTFCVSHIQDGKDPEFSAAKTVAEKLSTHHHELIISEAHIAKISAIVASYGEPVASFVPLHAHALAEAIGTHIRVALTGNGGDELFGGYADHYLVRRFEKRFELWRRLEKLNVRGLKLGNLLMALDRFRKKYAGFDEIPSSYLAATLRFSGATRFCQEVYTKQMKSWICDHNPADLLAERFEAHGAPTAFDGLLFQQLLLGSQHSIVDIPDISGMDHSLEYRSPFLDVRMIDLAARIPANMKIKNMKKGAESKWILRKVLMGRVPPEITRKKKAGFGSAIPYHRWMLREWSSYIEGLLNSDVLNDSKMFDQKKLSLLYLQAQNGRKVSLEMLWGVAMIAQWLKTFF